MPGAEVTNSELGLEQDPYNVPDRKGESVLDIETYPCNGLM